MTPSNTAFYSAYSAWHNSVFFRYFRLNAFVFYYLQNLFLCKFCGSAPFANIRCPVYKRIGSITGRRIPSQIGQLIVRRVAIIMATIESNRAFSDEGSQNNTANPKNGGFTVLPQKEKESSIFLVCCRFFHVTSFYIPYASSVGNFINRFIPDYRSPSFSHCGVHN